MEDLSPSLTMTEPAKYRIRVIGEIDESWADYYGGMLVRIENHPDKLKESILVGWLEDQAALVGLIERLYNLGLPILSVEKLSESGSIEIPKGE
jgi:hypothetical protein